MLEQTTHYRHPFPHVTGTTRIPEQQLQMWATLFEDHHPWQHRTESFYACALRDVTLNIEEVWCVRLRRAVSELLDIPLLPLVTVTAQQMKNGQSIGVHSDQPLLGYETARLVLQLNHEWKEGDGGCLALYAEQQGAQIVSHPPRWNSSTVFLLHPDSYHGVSETQRIRNSLVFNFWHPGNAPELKEVVHAWMHGLDFGLLPSSVDGIAIEAEQHLDEAQTYRAGVAAWLLHVWGFPDDIVVAGYSMAVGNSEALNHTEEARIAMAWSCWVARLYRDSFCPRRWAELVDESQGWQHYPRLSALGPVLFPPPRG